MPYESVLDGLEGKVSEAASLINNQYGTLEYQPVQVSWQSMSVEDYVALLSLSHCLLITSERDSINTAILDYVICQTEAFELVSSPHQSKVSRWGVPVISEFLGLSSFMPASFQINPFDYDVSFFGLN